MNDDRTFERAVDAWLEAGSDRTPQPAVDAVLLAVRTTPQDRDLRIPWRTPTMSNPVRLVAAIAIIALVGVLGLNYLRPESGPAVGAAPTPDPTATPEPSPTPSPTPISSADLLETIWTEYTSSEYGFTLAYPSDWTYEPATRAWTYEADGDKPGLWTTPASEHFTAPAGDVRVSAWSVPIDPAAIPSWADLRWSDIAAWAQEDCAKLIGGVCDGIAERAEPMCLERRDCHEAAVLIPGQEEVIAYVLDYDNARMQIVVVWQPDLDPSVAPYGGARKLLEAFLEPMNIWPPLPEQMPAS